MREEEHWVYILRCRDGTLYTGYTNSLSRRMKLHDVGKGAKYTRGRGPFALVYTESVESRSRGLKREREIKGMTREGKLRLINGKEERYAVAAEFYSSTSRGTLPRSHSHR